MPDPSDQGFSIADMSIFGHCPAHDDFYLVVCNHCSQVVKPQAFQKHCGEGSPREEMEGAGGGGTQNLAGWEVKCVMEEGLGDRRVLGAGGLGCQRVVAGRGDCVSKLPAVLVASRS